MNLFEHLLKKAQNYGRANTAVVNPVDEVSLEEPLLGLNMALLTLCYMVRKWQ